MRVAKMKILELRFKNLNSLYGEWSIDFTSPEYISNGIFALTGPTGSGKSTILDAICLALYAATPRLGKITKSSNEIMSRSTGECFSEVLFESNGHKYRVFCEQHRARKKPDGKLTEVKHEISNEETGLLIETKKSLVPGVIEKKTGMDFDRFTRSILLAQGGFDTFLKADIEEKSKILEQITGTGIYTTISQKVHQKKAGENKALELLTAETKGIVLLDAEQEKQLICSLDEMTKKEISLKNELQENKSFIDWRRGITFLKNEITEFNKEHESLSEQIKQFEPNKQRLERAQKADKSSELFGKITELREQVIKNNKNIIEKEKALPSLQQSYNKSSSKLKKENDYYKDLKNELKALSPILKQIRQMDTRLADQSEEYEKLKNECIREKDIIEELIKSSDKEREKLKLLQTEFDTNKSYLETNYEHEKLISHYSVYKAKLLELIGKLNKLSEKETIKNKNLGSNDLLIEKFNTLKKQLEKNLKHKKNNELIIKEDQLKLSQILNDKPLREIRNEMQFLLKEQGYIKTILKLEDERKKLKDGLPCPLCGSLDHPYALGNIPVLNETEKKIETLTKLIENSENLELLIKNRETEIKNYENKIHEIDKKIIDTENKINIIEEESKRLFQDIDSLKAEINNLKSELVIDLKPFNINELMETEKSIMDSINILGILHQKWISKIENSEKINAQIMLINNSLSGSFAAVKTKKEALIEKKLARDNKEKQWLKGLDERNKLYGNKIPDQEEACLNQKIIETEKKKKNLEEINKTDHKTLISSEIELVSLRKSVNSLTPKLKTLETQFLSSLKKENFIDEEDYIQARLSSEKRDELIKTQNFLTQNDTAIKTKKLDREAKLKIEQSLNKTDINLEGLETISLSLERDYQEHINKLTEIKIKLAENSTARKRIKEKENLINAQKKECEKWNNLHNLIGSENGKKFRNFAQGLTFEIMVAHANQELCKMSDRYLLIRDKMNPLDLNVLDNYQAGEIRSVKNLSGGESFIVSLTLALGLSKMASKKVKIDSLFLDEGFGTLDEESLESALETLSGLNQEGKLIGIISHVAALKERITTQINISATSGGKSVISGPGCKIN